MKKRIALLTLLSLFFLSLASVSYSQSDQDVAEWTILVFLNADNNLYGAGLDDLEEMKKVGSTKDVNVVVQFDGLKKGDSRRYYIRKGTAEMVHDFSEVAGEVDMGSWQTLTDFMLWGVSNYPAKKYFVVIWNHGSGALNTLTIRNNVQAISYDETSGSYITTVEMGRSLEILRDQLGRKIDIYGSDACLMAMLEVNYEIMEYADYIVGSQALEPGDGWPYDDFLKGLNADPKMDPQTLGSLLVKVYNQSYDSGSQGRSSVTLSLVNTYFMDMFPAWLDRLSEVLLGVMPQERQAIKTILKNTQNFGYASSRDLYDFMLKLNANLSDYPEIAETSAYIIDLLNQTVVANGYLGSVFQNSYGMSIWLPDNPMSFYYDREEYLKLRFGRESAWVNFLDGLYEDN